MQFSGIAGSEGVAIGKAHIFRRREIAVDRRRLAAADIPAEIGRWAAAVRQAKQQLTAVRERAAAAAGEENARIFDAHILLVEDAALFAEVEALVRAEGLTAAWALERVAAGYAEVFAAMDDENLRERAADIRDVAGRLLGILAGQAPEGFDCLSAEAVVIAAELTPSDMAALDRRLVKGLAVASGGRTSHAAIMARTLEIPAVFGLGDVVGRAGNGDMVIVDGTAGTVIVNPDEQQLASYRDRAARQSRIRAGLRRLKELPAVTADGRRIELAANIGAPRDADAVAVNGGDGVGLYRTEFLYMEKSRPPSEEEQFTAYRTVAEKLGGKPVIIRTLDIGGDKEAACFKIPHEANPFMGWRAIRISLAERDMFRTQLRAILRASAFGNVRVMYPMISGVEEVRQANAVLAEAKAELRSAGTAFDENMRVGVMVEVPSAAITADIIAAEVDFLSIGTNDLCQYVLAADRTNERVAGLYQPLHPAVLRLIKQVTDAARRSGKAVGMCGELAGDPMATIILVGLGLDELSMSAPSIPVVKRIVRAVSRERAEAAAAHALGLRTAEETTGYAGRVLQQLYSEIEQEDICTQ